MFKNQDIGEMRFDWNSFHPTKAEENQFSEWKGNLLKGTSSKEPDRALSSGIPDSKATISPWSPSVWGEEQTLNTFLRNQNQEVRQYKDESDIGSPPESPDLEGMYPDNNSGDKVAHALRQKRVPFSLIGSKASGVMGQRTRKAPFGEEAFGP